MQRAPARTLMSRLRRAPQHWTRIKELTGDLMAHWLRIGRPGGRGPDVESGISHNNPGALQDHYEIL